MFNSCNSIGQFFGITVAGESHGPALVVSITGCPSGLCLSEKEVTQYIQSQDIPDKELGTKRIEPNDVSFLSGIFKNRTLGQPIVCVVKNKAQRSEKYKATADILVPGHGDFGYWKRYGHYDYNGGGRSSGRECIVRLVAGYIAKKIFKIAGMDIKFDSKIVQLGGFDIGKHCSYEEAKQKCLDIYKKEKNSTGGVIELRIKNVPAGVGSPVFNKLHAQMAYALMTIGGIKGVEIGDGFKAAKKKGDEHNDPFGIIDGKIRPLKNSAGGFLGGISTGEDIIFRIAVKPTPKIPKTQHSVNKKTMTETPISMSMGGFDCNFTPRVIPIAESMLATVLLDNMMYQRIIPDEFSTSIEEI